MKNPLRASPEHEATKINVKRCTNKKNPRRNSIKERSSASVQYSILSVFIFNIKKNKRRTESVRNRLQCCGAGYRSGGSVIELPPGAESVIPDQAPSQNPYYLFKIGRNLFFLLLPVPYLLI
jgi:hypothetical protein